MTNPTIYRIIYRGAKAMNAALTRWLCHRQLTPEAQIDRDNFNKAYNFTEGNCSCHIYPPCGSCTHSGNPKNQWEDEECWEIVYEAIPTESDWIVTCDGLPNDITNQETMSLEILKGVVELVKIELEREGDLLITPQGTRINYGLIKRKYDQQFEVSLNLINGQNGLTNPTVVSLYYSPLSNDIRYIRQSTNILETNKL